MKPSVRSFAQKAKHLMSIAVSILLAGIIILAGVLLAWSPGKPEPFLDENEKPLAGSISEKIFVDINGVQQGMFIKGWEACAGPGRKRAPLSRLEHRHVSRDI